MRGTRKVIQETLGISFGGFARQESSEYWTKRTVGFAPIEVTGFEEQGVLFSRSGYMGVLIVDDPYQNGRTARIITEPADDDVGRIHNRQPVIKLRWIIRKN
mgnify:CR=1 FL=1